MTKLKGKVAVITGANSGIGLATAKLFAKEGARVVITGRREDALLQAAAEIEGEVLPVLADAGKIDDIRKVISTTVAKFGNIDILFPNAGIAPFQSVEQTSEELFDEVIGINLKGPFFLVKEALPYLNKEGVVVFNTTIAQTKGFAHTGAYVASKAGLRSLVRILTTELKEKGIRAVAVSPGPIDTPIYGKLGKSEEEVQQMETAFAAQVPLGRFGSADEVAKTVLFLASSEASFVNGAELVVDGGLSMV
ncbi:SDR family oxidoreductase [Fulvivirga sp. 29W222]|uniref:SDR family oxidoreductase n=1 Tax=Fulvivirga marina TaxID=2494733 RepID=A0A937KCE7_9BACT|nr:SDR family oxidoreductase [Fulvivirga marina]MBL6444890.1 SDR family oxidoreductase [Fulvivirga marina]